MKRIERNHAEIQGQVYYVHQNLGQPLARFRIMRLPVVLVCAGVSPIMLSRFDFFQVVGKVCTYAPFHAYD